VGLTVESKVLALVHGRFLWHFPYLERIQGSSTGCEGVLWDPRDPLGSQPRRVPLQDCAEVDARRRLLLHQRYLAAAAVEQHRA
jgi:hypothetical protein